MPNHPQWWPRVAETEMEELVEELSEGVTYRQLTRTPSGHEEMRLTVESVDEFKGLSIRCLTTGTFVRFDLTGAQDGTFVDGQMGMEPRGLGNRVFDVFAGRRYFGKWIEETFIGLERAASRDPRPERPEAS